MSRLGNVSGGNGFCPRRYCSLAKLSTRLVSTPMRAWLCRVTGSSSSSLRGGMSDRASEASCTKAQVPSLVHLPMCRPTVSELVLNGELEIARLNEGGLLQQEGIAHRAHVHALRGRTHPQLGVLLYAPLHDAR